MPAFWQFISSAVRRCISCRVSSFLFCRSEWSKGQSDHFSWRPLWVHWGLVGAASLRNLQKPVCCRIFYRRRDANSTPLLHFSTPINCLLIIWYFIFLVMCIPPSPCKLWMDGWSLALRYAGYLHAWVNSNLVIFFYRTSVVCPMIDVISDDTFEYSLVPDMTCGGFNWRLSFRWYTASKRELERRGGDRSLPMR